MCLLDLLFGPKEEQFSPSPDNLPPDDAMMFQSGVPSEYDPLPPGFLYYEFGPSYDESDPVAIELGRQILDELCKSRQVLLEFWGSKQTDKKGREIPSEFIPNYTEMLKRKQVEFSVYQPQGPFRFPDDRKFVYLVSEYSAELLTGLYTIKPYENWFLNFYLFPKDKEPFCAADAWEKVKTNQYAMRVEHINHGLMSVEMFFDPKRVKFEDIDKVVEDVCARNNVVLVHE